MSVFTPPDAILLVAIAYALYTDLKTGLIRNHLTFPAMLVGFALNYALRGGPGVIDALMGTILAFALFGLPYSIGWQGAGDVKLMMAVGALEGWRFVLISLMFYMVASFILSLVFIAIKIHTRGKEGKDYITRMAIAIAFGMTLDSEGDKAILKSNTQWSPAIFAGTLAALVYLRSLTPGAH